MVSFGASPHPLYSAGNATDTHLQAFIIIAMLPVTVHAALQISSNSSVCHRSALFLTQPAATKFGLGLHIQDANLADLPMMGYLLWSSAVRSILPPHLRLLKWLYLTADT